MSDSSPDPTIEEILASIRRIISEEELSAAPAARSDVSGPAGDEGEPLVLTNVINGAGAAHDPLRTDEALVMSEPEDEPAAEPAAALEPEPEDHGAAAVFEAPPAAPSAQADVSPHNDGETLLLEDVEPILAEASVTEAPQAEAPPMSEPDTADPAPPPPSPSAPPAEEAVPPGALEEPLVGDRAAEAMAKAFGALERTLQMPPSARTLEDLVREMLRPLLKAWLEEHLPAIVEAKVADEVERIARLRR